VFSPRRRPILKRWLRRHLRLWARWCWGAVLFTVITLAVIVQLGKAIFPVLNDYREEMETHLSARLGVGVSIGDIRGDWTGLRPRVTLAGVAVRNSKQELVFRVDEVSGEVNLLSTLRDWRLAFRKVTFSGMQVAMSQNQEGTWWVAGLQRGAPRPPPTDGPRFNDPVDIFLFGRRVELRNTHLTFLFRDGLSTELAIPYIRLENDTQFHRLAATFAVDEEQQSLQLVVEGEGDPRDDAHFNSRGYLHMERFPSEKVLAALGVRDSLWPSDTTDAMDASWRDDGRVTLSLWFEGSSSRGVTWTGDVMVEGSPVRAPDGVQWPDALTSRFSGSWEPQRGWQVSAADTRLIWPEFSAPPLDLQLRGSFGGDPELAIAALDLAGWNEGLQRAGVLRGAIEKVFADLQPQGELRNLHIVRRPAEQGYFVLRGNLVDASVGAWQGAPELHGVTGYVEAGAFGGEIRLRTDQGFSMNFPLIYHQPLAFDRAEGTVRWEIDRDARTVYISSGLVQLENQEVSARGHFNLHLPIGGEPEMTLMVGVKEGHAGLHRTLVPFTAPEPLLEWLDRAIVGGNVRNASFIYHGSLAKEATIARVIQLRGLVSNAEVAFDPAWPPLRQGSGLLYLDDENLTVTGMRGAMEQILVTDARVDLVQLDGERRAVRVKTSAQGESGDATALLAKTPLRDLGGEELMSWQWQGPVTAKLDVQVPLDNNQKGAYQKVALDVAENQLHMPGLELTFEKVTGSLTYDTAQGVASPGIKARLWDKPVSAVLSTEQSPSGSELVARLKGKADVADVQQWSKRPELAFAQGTSAVTGELRVPMGGDAPLRLIFNSSLEGVELMAPAPFQKPASQELPLQVLVESRHAERGATSYRYSFTLDDLAELRLAMRNGQVQAADLAFDQVGGPMQDGIFQIRGAVQQADAMLWWGALQRYLAVSKSMEAAASTATTEAGADLPFRVDLQVAQLQAGDTVLEQARVRASETRGTWEIGLEHPTLAGTAMWSADDKPIQLQLQRLYLPEQDAEDTGEQVAVGDGIAVSGDPFVAETDDFWLSLDLTAIPAADVSIADLRRGKTELGRWDFKLRPIERGLMLYDLTAESVGLTIVGRGKPGAELVWTRTPNGDNSYFSGLIRAGNLADTFRRLSLEPALTSESATFDVELQWAAPPVGINLLSLAGVVDLSVQRGVFSRGAGVGDNPLLKLIGLLNFDTLARRLRLDFSDLSSTGLAYEDINGTLLFRKSRVHIQQPLQVNTPSSYLQLVGELDVAQETLDTQLVATLPLAGNLTVAAAVTGGVPLAIGVYVVGKIFKDQVERVSSLRYKVSGSWNDPKVKLERIFENTVAEPTTRAATPEELPREP
jgi:uncharacterized protein (TIGR02099 family)